ncbi:MAG: zinc-dependent peptidase [Cellvibrionaceae bacterium]|nr:zinc-dependent peptidase [Cellvibrionaceae bacterium]
MRDPVLFYVIVGGLACALLGSWAWRQYRWHKARHAEFPSGWLSLVRKALPHYDYMPAPLQQQLQAHIRRFLFTKEFVGCAGLVVTDEMRITIAACASLLLLNRPTLEFQNVRWIYLYPAEFVVRHTVEDAAGVVTSEDGVLVGEAWNNGRVILSWDDVQQGVYDFNDGRNVVLHEFAHQLDAESGSMNGAPCCAAKAPTAAGRRSSPASSTPCASTPTSAPRRCSTPTAPPIRRSFSPWPPRASSKSRICCLKSTRSSSPNCSLTTRWTRGNGDLRSRPSG